VPAGSCSRPGPPSPADASPADLRARSRARPGREEEGDALHRLRTGGARAGRELAEAREAGLADGEIVQVVAHVAARVFTNAAAILAETEIDFPKAPRLPSN
jgi:hypothetical protein